MLSTGREAEGTSGSQSRYGSHGRCCSNHHSVAACMGLAVIAGLALNCRAPLPSLRAELPAGRLSAIVFVAALFAWARRKAGAWKHSMSIGTDHWPGYPAQSDLELPALIQPCDLIRYALAAGRAGKCQQMSSGSSAVAKRRTQSCVSCSLDRWRTPRLCVPRDPKWS